LPRQIIGYFGDDRSGENHTYCCAILAAEAFHQSNDYHNSASTCYILPADCVVSQSAPIAIQQQKLCTTVNPKQTRTALCSVHNENKLKAKYDNKWTYRQTTLRCNVCSNSPHLALRMVTKAKMLVLTIPAV